ncbi:hypothetical protein BHE74_00040710 [Ensete ventricosum]|nr:hypothetical protein BHE74_00040710 [Ensete ventricosum]RZS26496.1 hypothetical protein BHM03_00059850 [Ensete ventricosum]
MAKGSGAGGRWISGVLLPTVDRGYPGSEHGAAAEPTLVMRAVIAALGRIGNHPLSGFRARKDDVRMGGTRHLLHP